MVRCPRPLQHDPSLPRSEDNCFYLKGKGYPTIQCWALWENLEKLIRQGFLKEYILTPETASGHSNAQPPRKQHLITMKKRKPTKLKSDKKQNQNLIKKLDRTYDCQQLRMGLSTDWTNSNLGLKQCQQPEPRLSKNWATTIDRIPIAIDRLLNMHSLFCVSTYSLSTTPSSCRQWSSAPVSSSTATQWV